MINKITIFGERCSGTNYLQILIEKNFLCEITWMHEPGQGHKHFFGFDDHIYKNSDNTLFICIVRNPIDWINSFYRNPHHIIDINCHSIENFINNEIVSYQFNSKRKEMEEIIEDRHIYTKKRYKNIFELRYIN